MSDTIPVIAFDNQLSYDVIVYDSFDNDDDDTSATTTNGNGAPTSQTYFATLTQLGKIPAGQTVNIQPIHDSSSFILESASDSKPIKHMVALSFDDVTSLSIAKADEEAMTQTFQFISFFLNNPNDAISVAFNKVLNDTTDDQATAIDNFFVSQPSYNKCSFMDYMMALAYSALHPTAPNPSQPAGSSSLKTISTLMGSRWPTSLSDIFVTKFTCATKDKHLILTFEVDISTLPFESVEIASNILSMLNGTKMMKAQITFNYAQVGLNIFSTRLSFLEDAFVLPTGDNKTVTIQKPSITIDINPLFKFVVCTIEGTFPFNINGKTFNALASFVIDNDEAAIGVDIQGDKSSLPPPPDLKGLHFDEFGVGMGLFFKPPGFGLGIQGKFHIGDSSTNVVSLDDNSFALVCEFVEEAIEPKYVSFYIPRLDLNTVVTLFTNKTISLDVPVNFTDLSFHWSDGLMDCVALPDGTLSNGGYGFSAAVDLFSFGFYGEANLDINTGLTANIEVSPVNWNNIFKLEGDGKGYSMKYDKAGNPIKNNFVPSTQAEKDAVAAATNRAIVDPGGAVLIINTLSMPILHLNAKASLFDLLDFAVQADINKDGIKFELDYGAILTEKMVCNLSDFHNLYAEFGYHIDKSIPLPPIGGINPGYVPLKTDASLHLAITTSLTDVLISAGGKFDFGYHFSFGDFNVDINISKITDFVGAIVQYIIDEAKSIFSLFIDTAEHWAAAAGIGIVTGFDDAGKVMKNAFGKSAQEMVNILKGAGFAANDIAKGLKNGYGAASQEVAALMKDAGYTADEVGSAIKNCWNCGLNDVTWAMHEAGYSAAEVAASVQHAFNALAQDVTNSLKWLGYAANEVGNVIKNIFGGDSVGVAKVMKAAGYAADEVANAIKNAWNCGLNDVTWAMHQVGYSAAEVAASVQHAFNALAQDVTNSLKWLGYAANEVGNVIKNIFGGDSIGVAKVMKAAGYAAEEVAGAIKNAWNCGVNDVTYAMKAVGYIASDIAAALKNAFNAGAQDVANSFKAFGIAANDAADAVKNVFGEAMNDTASILKQAGYATVDVASALKNTFNTSVNAVADAMKQAGYAANDVKNAFEDLGDDFKSFADAAWNDVKNSFNPSNW